MTTNVLSVGVIAIVSVVFLGVQAAAMSWLGHRYGRRGAPGDLSAVAKRAGLWSLLLSWTFMAGLAGHGAVVNW